MVVILSVVCCSVIVVSAGVYGFFLAKKSVDKNRVELMKSRQRLRAAQLQEQQQKLVEDH